MRISSPFPRPAVGRRRGVLAVAAAATVVVAGCSASGSDFRDTAVKVIETDLAESAGLGDLEGACDEVADDVAVGDTFNCTGTTPDGEEIQFVASIKSDDEVAVDSTNLISADGMTALETTALSLLSEQVGQPFEADAIDCGAGPRVFDVATDVLTCDLTDPISGAIYETTIELTGLGAEDQMSIVVAETPKG